MALSFNNVPSGPSANDAIEHLRQADPVLAALIDRAPDTARLTQYVEASYKPELEPYGSLIRAIVGQQLSVAAARSMWNKLLAAFGGSAPDPQTLLGMEVDDLRRQCGLSRAKAASLRSLAEHVLDGRLELDRFDEMTDAEVEAELIAVKGIGPWTTHMFLMTQLGRRDILAPGDLGIRKGVQLAYGLDELPSADEVVIRAEAWRPWRSVACRLLWASLEFEPL
jgi:DNA-3-methyladenine glycosylase II